MFFPLLLLLCANRVFPRENHALKINSSYALLFYYIHDGRTLRAAAATAHTVPHTHIHTSTHTHTHREMYIYIYLRIYRKPVPFKWKTQFVYIITFVLILFDDKQTGIRLLVHVPLLASYVYGYYGEHLHAAVSHARRQKRDAFFAQKPCRAKTLQHTGHGDFRFVFTLRPRSPPPKGG